MTHRGAGFTPAPPFQVYPLAPPVDGNGASAFLPEEVAAKTGHNWWAAQWSPSLKGPADPELVKDYWESSRPAINYEGRYYGLWTGNFGSRVQGWVSFLSGFFGYGYGAIDIWLYQSTYDIGQDSFNGIDTITREDKLKPWSEAVGFESAGQMTFMRTLLESFDWWNLVPVLAGDPSFIPEASAYAYARSQETRILYFFSTETKTGALLDFSPGQKISLRWFNPRTGQEAEPFTRHADASGRLDLPERLDTNDWVLLINS
ncbi:MAG: DUF4038 domain-containing protein [Bacteroidales bacterium]|nr:DUF4038 domain-containing protein [Bacteroidales bacterium]